MTSEVHDVIIIGAGLSGLSAAKLLNDQGFDVVVIEARSRVGGRTYTRKDAKYGWCDVGASYVGPQQNRILRLADSLGVQTYKVYREGDNLFYHKGRPLRYGGSWPHWNPMIWLDCNNLFRTMDQLADKVPLEAPWDAPDAEIWDNMTAKEWLDKMCWTQAAREWGTQFVNSNIAAEPSEVSLLFLLWYIKSGGGILSMWELEGAAQDRKFIGGSQQISERIAELLQEKVHLSQPVSYISDHDIVEVHTMEGQTFHGRYVIVAMPPAMQLKLTYEPPLPPLKNQILQRMPMGSCIKLQMFYEKPFWREKGLNGITSIADGATPIGDTIDDCAPGVKYAALTGFLLGDNARKYAHLPKEEKMQMACQCYSKFFNAEEALRPVYYEDQEWMSESWTGGCFTSICQTGTLTRYGRTLRQAHGNVFFAGTETALRWCGFMDGAVEAGERAAREILNKMGKLEQEDIYREEPEFMGAPYEPIEKSMWEAVAPSVGGVFNGLVVSGSVLVAAMLLQKYGYRLPRLF